MRYSTYLVHAADLLTYFAAWDSAWQGLWNQCATFARQQKLTWNHWLIVRSCSIHGKRVTSFPLAGKQHSDLENTSLGDFRASLEVHLKVEAGSLEGKKEKIQELLMANLQGGRTAIASHGHSHSPGAFCESSSQLLLLFPQMCQDTKSQTQRPSRSWLASLTA